MTYIDDIKAFQETNGLYPDGVVGAKTWPVIADKLERLAQCRKDCDGLERKITALEAQTEPDMYMEIPNGLVVAVIGGLVLAFGAGAWVF